MYTYKAKAISVYDGDTVTLVVDLGFKISTEVKLRLEGIDTPELRRDQATSERCERSSKAKARRGGREGADDQKG